MKQKPLIDESGEVRELTREDIKRFKPAAGVLPRELLAVLPKRKPRQLEQGSGLSAIANRVL